MEAALGDAEVEFELVRLGRGWVEVRVVESWTCIGKFSQPVRFEFGLSRRGERTFPANVQRQS